MGAVVIACNSLLCKRKKVLLNDELLALEELYFKNYMCLKRMEKYLLSLSSVFYKSSLSLFLYCCF